MLRVVVSFSQTDWVEHLLACQPLETPDKSSRSLKGRAVTFLLRLPEGIDITQAAIAWQSPQGQIEIADRQRYFKLTTKCSCQSTISRRIAPVRVGLATRKVHCDGGSQRTERHPGHSRGSSQNLPRRPGGTGRS